MRTSRRPGPCPAGPHGRALRERSLNPAGILRRPARPRPCRRAPGPERRAGQGRPGLISAQAPIPAPGRCGPRRLPQPGAGAARRAARSSPLLFRSFEDELGGFDAGILRHVGIREGRADGAGSAPSRAEAPKPRPGLRPAVGGHRRHRALVSARGGCWTRSLSGKIKQEEFKITFKQSIPGHLSRVSLAWLHGCSACALPDCRQRTLRNEEPIASTARVCVSVVKHMS